jgi:hypothetical protein
MLAKNSSKHVLLNLRAGKRCYSSVLPKMGCVKLMMLGCAKTVSYLKDSFLEWSFSGNDVTPSLQYAK